jgi:cyclomaltodextrinase
MIVPSSKEAPHPVVPGRRPAVEPDWVAHAIFWHLYPLGFTGADIRPIAPPKETRPRLRLLIDWLDYAIELGASALLLGPIFAASTHGYDTLDHFRIDPRLGGEEDFDALVTAAKARGLHIVLDGVFNHVGRDHPAFKEFVALGRAAPTAEWFRLDGSTSRDAPKAAVFEGHEGLVALNHEVPAIERLVVDAMIHWLDRGASGWRLDAAYAVPASFWARVLPRVRARHPHAYLFGEIIHGDYSGYVRESGLDSVTQYELWKAIWSALNDRNFFELAWALDRHNAMLDDFAPQTFIGNHDVTRIASRLADPQALPLALAILMTLGGTPSIYAGDEQAFLGVKEARIGGDDAVRAPFPNSPADLAPRGWPVYRLHQELIGLRRRHAWLHRARSQVLHLTNTRLTYEAAADGRRVVVALNLEGEGAQAVPSATRLLAGQGRLVEGGTPEATVNLPANGWAILA